jgi:hypothetical protein
MNDRILERRMRIENALQTPEYKLWVQYRDEIRKTTCSFYSPNEPDVSKNVCESCSNYEFCSHIKQEQSQVPLIPTIA